MGGPLESRSSSSTDTYQRQAGAPYYIYNTPTDDGNWTTNSNIRVGTSVSGSTYTLTLVFPANCHTIFLRGTNSQCANIFPKDLKGRKFGNPSFDNVETRVNNTSPGNHLYRFIAKVYSPYKKCMCLKSFLNGEVPILNE